MLEELLGDELGKLIPPSLRRKIKKRPRREKTSKATRRRFVAFVIWLLKFLNLYAWIRATIKNPQTNISNSIYKPK